MHEDRRERIELLVDQALKLPPDERTAFIQKECGDDEALFREIQSLLRSGDKAFTFIHGLENNIVAPSLNKIAKNQFNEKQRIGTVVEHYEITGILGTGGMGVVYKAKDTKLDRTVALKFLPLYLTWSDKDKERFIREAKAAAALNQPNICTIYSVEEYENQYFISMEYIDGQTLREKIESKEGVLSSILEYCIQITSALAEAHEKGIIHRDIKPENIMLDPKNRIKVMDFGIAQLQSKSRITEQETNAGSTLYMSPEQAKGMKVDHRTDIWSMGVVLYEMIAGKHPFAGESDHAVIHSILNKDPEPLDKIENELLEKFNKIVLKCLKKNADERYQSMDEIIIDLHQIRIDLLQDRENKTSLFFKHRARKNVIVSLSTILVLLLVGYWLLPFHSTKISPEHTIAILPLESISQHEDDIQFANEIHVELVNRLAGIGDLTVIARSSVLGYEPGERDIRQIGEQLGVSTIMEGTVRRFDDQFRLTLELIDTENLGTIWSGTFQESFDNVFEIQSRVARQVAGELHASLTEDEQERLEEPPTDNPQAYRLYMKGREYLSRTAFSEDNLLMAEELLRKAIDEDREFAQAWGMLALTYSYFYWVHGRSPEHLQKMGEAAEWALLFGPGLAETYIANGVYLYWSNTNNQQTLSHFEMALQKFPNQPVLHFMTAYTNRRLGNWEELIEYLNNALELDPLNTNIHTEIAYDYWLMRDYDKAEAIIIHLMELEPNSNITFLFNARIGLSKYGTLENFEIWWDHIRPEDPAVETPHWWGVYNTLKRDWEEALHGFKNIENEIRWEDLTRYIPRQYLIAVTLDHQENHSQALSYYEQLCDELESLRDTYTDMPRYRTALGKVYARLGEHEKAVKEAEKITELMTPYLQDREIRVDFEMELAEILAWAGQEDQAIDKLEYLLSVPSRIHRNILRLDPTWDPLRDHPRFQALIAGEDKPYLEGL